MQEIVLHSCGNHTYKSEKESNRGENAPYTDEKKSNRHENLPYKRKNGFNKRSVTYY